MSERVNTTELRIILVRHGITEWNVAGRMQGQTDVPLSLEGLRQAEIVAQRLARESIAAVYSSDLSRALVTAEAIAVHHRHSVIASPLLREYGLGDWEGMTEAEIIQSGDEELLRNYRGDPVRHRPRSGESLDAIWNRILAVRDEIRSVHVGCTAVVVGHGGSLKVFIADALGTGYEGVRRFTLDNASLSVIEYHGERAFLRSVNDTGHLR